MLPTSISINQIHFHTKMPSRIKTKAQLSGLKSYQPFWITNHNAGILVTGEPF